MRKYLYLLKSGPKPGADGMYRVTAKEIEQEINRKFFRSMVRSVLFLLGGFGLAQVIIYFCGS